MPLQNRVTPFSDLVAIPERGLMYGNRGVLHNEDRRIVRYNAGKRWIVCVLEFRGWHRNDVMAPNRFTGLFFLDEATAFAAGHRPCAECRHHDYQAFRRRWSAWDTRFAERPPSADEMDAQLHQERLAAPRTKRTYREDIATLADGVFIVRDGEPWLLWHAEMLHWTPGGYDQRLPRPARGDATVLTPRSTARTLAAGYVPGVHPSAQAEQ
jgi:hypothetical protein